MSRFLLVLAVVAVALGVAVVAVGGGTRPASAPTSMGAADPTGTAAADQAPNGPGLSPTGAAVAPSTSTSMPASQPPASEPPTTSTSPSRSAVDVACKTVSPTNAPAKAACQITAAYLSSPTDRRGACRPFDTDALDGVLGVPTWSGQGPTTTVTGPVSVTVGTPVAADITPTAIGYEITATIKGQATPFAVQVRVIQTGDGRWLADTLSVT